MTIPSFTLPGYTLRPPTSADIPAILDLLYAYDQAVMEEEPDRYTQEDILSDWENLDLSSDACVLLTGYESVCSRLNDLEHCLSLYELFVMGIEVDALLL